MLRSLVPVSLVLSALSLGACAGPAEDDDESSGSSESALASGATFTAKVTAYYPDSSAMEGGYVDRKGAKLRTLQQFLEGKADYVSVAMDTLAFAYGQRLRIRELDAKYGKAIVFKVVDTGGAFKGKDKTRIDVCVANRSASLDASVNGRVTIDVIAAGAPTQAAPLAGAEEDPASAKQETRAGAATGGPACASDGMCNPGNDGSGLVCSAGRCVPGCRTNAQCPGVTTCSAGQCR